VVTAITWPETKLKLLILVSQLPVTLQMPVKEAAMPVVRETTMKKEMMMTREMMTRKVTKTMKERMTKDSGSDVNPNIYEEMMQMHLLLLIHLLKKEKEKEMMPKKAIQEMKATKKAKKMKGKAETKGKRKNYIVTKCKEIGLNIQHHMKKLIMQT